MLPILLGVGLNQTTGVIPSGLRSVEGLAKDNWLQEGNKGAKYSLFFYNLSIPMRILLFSLFALSWLLYLSAKIAIFRSIFKVKLSERPINCLIFLEEISNMTVSFITVTWICHIILYQTPFGGVEFCHYANVVSYAFGFTFHKSISCGIGLIRVIYLTAPYITENRRWEKWLLLLIVALSATMAVSVSILAFMSESFKSGYNTSFVLRPEQRGFKTHDYWAVSS